MIDVGANAGQTIQTVKTLLPQARVVSIEPSPLVLPTLIQLAKRYNDVEIAAFAVGDSFGTAQICTPVANGIHFTQYATLAEVDRDALAVAITDGGFGSVTGEDVSIHKARCVIAPLDAMFSDCDVLKVDAEGYEDSVFRGAAQLVTRALPVLIVERPSSELSASLAELGCRGPPHGGLGEHGVRPSEPSPRTPRRPVGRSARGWQDGDDPGPHDLDHEMRRVSATQPWPGL